MAGSAYKLTRSGKPLRRADGTYIWCAEYLDAAGKRVTKSTFRSERQAKDFLASTRVSVRDGTHTPDRDSITVALGADLWVKARKADKDEGDLERSSYVKYEQHVRIYIKPKLGHLKLSQLRRQDVIGFLDAVRAGVSDAMAKRCHSDLKAILDHAMDIGKIAQNVALTVRRRRSKKRQREHAVSKRWQAGVDFPTEGEALQMLSLARNPPRPDKNHAPFSWRRHGWHVLYATVLETGARISELRGLPWLSVDHSKQRLTIEQRADEWGEIGAPKTVNSVRTIAISEALTKEFEGWLAEQPAAAREAKGLVFPNGRGNAESVQNLYARFLHPLQVAAGCTRVDEAGEVVPKYGWHAFRHYVASKRIAAGWDVVRVADLLGHSDPNTTLRYYAHMFDAAAAEREAQNGATPENSQNSGLKLAV